MAIVIAVFVAFAPDPYLRAVRLPAALMVATRSVMGALLGLSGIFLSTPFLVVVVILVRMLYVESTLGEEVEVMGKRRDPDPDRPKSVEFRARTEYVR